MASSSFTFTHNAMESGIATCNTDIADENFEYLKDIQDQKADIAPSVTLLSSSGTITLGDNKVYRISPTGAVTFSLPAVTDNTVFHQILVQVSLANLVQINFGTSNHFGETTPAIGDTGKYDIIYEHDGSAWYVGLVRRI